MPATVIGAEDAAFAGGSYVIVQKYLHDLPKWNQVPVERQEGFVGREKLSDIELSDAVKPSFAHNALTSITDEDGEIVHRYELIRPVRTERIRADELAGSQISRKRLIERIRRLLRNCGRGEPPERQKLGLVRLDHKHALFASADAIELGMLAKVRIAWQGGVVIVEG